MISKELRDALRIERREMAGQALMIENQINQLRQNLLKEIERLKKLNSDLVPIDILLQLDE